MESQHVKGLKRLGQNSLKRGYLKMRILEREYLKKVQGKRIRRKDKEKRQKKTTRKDMVDGYCPRHSYKLQLTK